MGTGGKRGRPSRCPSQPTRDGGAQGRGAKWRRGPALPPGTPLPGPAALATGNGGRFMDATAEPPEEPGESPGQPQEDPERSPPEESGAGAGSRERQEVGWGL